MLRDFTATLGPVVPSDGVTSRQFHQFDKDGNELVTILDPSAGSVEGSIDDSAAPGSCYLVDLNDAGPSEPSPAFALVPPGPGPGPSPGGVPATPSVLGVVFH